MHFDIGMRVVCVKDHSKGIVRQGQIFTIWGIDSCRCGMILLDIGIRMANSRRVCSCGHEASVGNIIDLDARLFAPLQQTPEISALTVDELIEELEETTVLNEEEVPI